MSSPTAFKKADKMSRIRFPYCTFDSNRWHSFFSKSHFHSHHRFHLRDGMGLPADIPLIMPISRSAGGLIPF